MEGFSGQEILSVMLQWWIHETSVRTHGRYKTKGEPWFKLWTLGDDDVPSRFISSQGAALGGTSTVGELYLPGGRVGCTQEVSVPSSQVCCEPETAKKKKKRQMRKKTTTARLEEA